MDNFDPVTFLGLNDLTEEGKNKIRPYLYEDMAKFLMNKFAESLSDADLDTVERKLQEIKTPTAVFQTIQQYNPDFGKQKADFLYEYRRDFKLEDFRKYL